MKGIIFNLAEEVVSAAYGEDTWDSLLDAAGLEGSYTSLGNYADDELFQLVGAASTALDLPAADVVRFLGTGAIPLLAERYPKFFEPHTTTSEFLQTLNDIIHPEVRKLYPGADVPDFGFEVLSPTSINIRYRSSRKLCTLAEGFIYGAAGVYGETAQIDQPDCMLEGADACILHCTFEPVA